MLFVNESSVFVDTVYTHFCGLMPDSSISHAMPAVITTLYLIVMCLIILLLVEWLSYDTNDSGWWLHKTIFDSKCN